jgi:hypothetical protein
MSFRGPWGVGERASPPTGPKSRCAFTPPPPTPPPLHPVPPQYYLANDQKLRRYVPLIKDSIVYPAIFDSRCTLLSLPPIINGAHSAVGRGFGGWRGRRGGGAECLQSGAPGCRVKHRRERGGVGDGPE